MNAAPAKPRCKNPGRLGPPVTLLLILLLGLTTAGCDTRGIGDSLSPRCSSSEDQLLCLGIEVTVEVTGLGSGSGTVNAPDPAVKIENCALPASPEKLCKATFIDANGVGSFELFAEADDGSIFRRWTGECASVSETVCTVEFESSDDVERRVYVQFDLASAQSIVFMDNFAVGDQWSAHVVSSGGTVTHSATNRATGGHGDNAGFREMEHVIDGVGSLHLFHRYEGGTYTPSDPDGGAIATIDFSAYRIVVDPQIQGGAVAGGFALEQGGTVYRAALEAFTNLDWEAEIRGGLTAADFAALDGSHPDFSASGSQMWFGYARANSSPNAGSMMRKHGIDDWKVEIHRQP